MPISQTKITGSVKLPDAIDAKLTGVTFQLIGSDFESGEIVAAHKVEATVDRSVADFNVELWPNDKGLRGGTYYTVAFTFDDGAKVTGINKLYIPYSETPQTLEDVAIYTDPNAAGKPVPVYLSEVMVYAKVKSEVNSFFSKVETITNSTPASGRNLDSYKTFPINGVINPNGEGGVVSNIPPGSSSPPEAARFWNGIEGDFLVQYYQETNGSKWYRRYNGGTFKSWQVVSLNLLGANLKAADRNFDGSVLLSDGVSAYFDGTQPVSNGPEGNKSYEGTLLTDIEGDQIRQKFYPSGELTPFVRVGGAGKPWTRSVVGFTGDQIVFLGDSITHGVGTDSAATESFPVIAARRLGCAYVKLGAAGGQMDSTGTLNDQQKNGSFVEGATANIAAITASRRLVVAFGTNDFNRDVPIGTINDTVRGTFYGAMYEGMRVVHNASPDTKIVFVTPTYRSISATDAKENTNSNGAGHKLEDYRVAIRAFAKKYGQQVIEGRDGVGIGQHNVLVLVPDGLHPNAKGAKLLGTKVSREIN